MKSIRGMSAITVQQPWADAIMFLGKDVENRTWQPPKRLIGQRIAIHAGKTFDKQGYLYLVKLLGERPNYPLAGRDPADLLAELRACRFQLGVLLGTVLLCGWSRRVERGVEFREIRGSGLARKAHLSRWAAPGQYQWALVGPRPLQEPIPYRGALGAWKLPPEIYQQISSQLDGSPRTSSTP